LKHSDYSKTRAKWRRWINRINESATRMVLYDYMFLTSMGVAERDKIIKPTNEIYKWVQKIYGTDAAISVRCILDEDKRTYSLMLLLRKIVQNPQVITRRSFVYKYSEKFLGQKDFDNLTSIGINSLPRKVVEQDLYKLEKIASRIRPIVNKVIAHRERKPKGLTKITWNELHYAIKEIEKMCIRYSLILNQKGIDTMLPSINASRCRSDASIIWGKRNKKKNPKESLKI